jgi:hypothetical protein
MLQPPYKILVNDIEMIFMKPADGPFYENAGSMFLHQCPYRRNIGFTIQPQSPSMLSVAGLGSRLQLRKRAGFPPQSLVQRYPGNDFAVFNADGSALPTALNQTSTSSRQIQFGLKLVC